MGSNISDRLSMARGKHDPLDLVNMSQDDELNDILGELKCSTRTISQKKNERVKNNIKPMSVKKRNSSSVKTENNVIDECSMIVDAENEELRNILNELR